MEKPPPIKDCVKQLVAQQREATTWECMQMKHDVDKAAQKPVFCRDRTEFEQICDSSGPVRHSLSKIYKLLFESQIPWKPAFIDKWELELGISLSP